jgi:hypothetical protein
MKERLLDIHYLVNTSTAPGEPNDRSFDDFASGQHHQELLAGNYI